MLDVLIASIFLVLVLGGFAFHVCGRKLVHLDDGGTIKDWGSAKLKDGIL